MNFHVAGFHRNFGANFPIENPVPDRGICLDRPSRGVKGRDASLRIRLRNPRTVPVPAPVPVVVSEKPRRAKLSPVVHARNDLTHAPKITMAEIQSAVCAVTGQTVMAMKSSRRTVDIVTSRHIAILICVSLTTCSLPQIGRAFGGRDHTTVLHALRKMKPVEDELNKILKPTDPVITWALEAVRLERELKPVSPKRKPCPAPAT